ncbi:MAG TPA: peptidylprolyl isomerase [Blastocatellia bacterium]|nr:peptidylprolyl isomerase [Blastocatellia bacterium]
MAAAKTGDSVKVHYTGTLDDGTVFDSSADQEPLGFTLGSGEVIEGFENAVIGMEVGESKTITVPPDQAYGPHTDALVQTVARDQVRLGVEPEVGMAIEMQTPDGAVIPLLITAVTDTTLTFDANHPLAGEQLRFELTLVEIG